MRKVKQWVVALLLITQSLTNCLAVAAESLPADSPTDSLPASVVETALPEKAEQETTVREESAEKTKKTTIQSATIHASVPAAGAAYSVVIPEGLYLGKLDASREFQQDYTVSVEVYHSDKPVTVTVSSEDSFPMIRTDRQNATEQMTCYNAFETTAFKKSGQVSGRLSIPKEEIAAAALGRYAGTLKFTIFSQRQSGGEVPGPEDTAGSVVPPAAKPVVPPAAKPVVPPAAKPVVPPAAKPVVPPANNDKAELQSTATPEQIDMDSITQDGHYTVAVSMRKENAFDELSMCDKLFYPKADVERKGDMATVKMYVIDPVPKFANEGTPLRNMSLAYNGKNYSVQVNSGSKVTKQFDAAPGFIDKAGEYPATPLVVTLPVKALEDSANKAVTSNAFVNAVMKQNVNFYIVFSDLQPGETTTGATFNKKPKGDSFGKGGNTIDPVNLPLGEGEKSWYTSAVSMRRADNFDKESMCDPLFFEKADIMYQGDTAELTLYVIDPVPKFADVGTPIKDVKFLYDEKAYTATVHSDKKQEKKFDAAAGFISEAGEYPATPIKVVLPKQAVETSIDGKLKCSAYINTVMNTTQEFYVVLSELEEGQPSADQLEADTPDDTGQDEKPQTQQVAAPASEVVSLHTKLFPQVLWYVLFTAVILGGAFAAQWFRRR